ncbi:MAG: ABC transporter permease [Firmicutes bacterium]|nr:ABC transporter permease [Bacillota bacterium]
MLSYFIKRLLGIIPVLLVASLIVFLMLQLTPGDPVLLLAGERATPERIERITRDWGLDQPAYVQYFTFLGRIIKGDFGMSITRNRPVADLIRISLPITLELSLAALFVSLAIGIPAGIISAVKHGSIIDQVALFGSLLGVSIPAFWFGILLMLAFAVKLPILPTSGYGTFAQLILPAVALGTAGAALISRVMRSSMLEVMQQDFIRTARAKGLSERVVIYRHALRNALLPVITIMGLSLGWLLAGSVALEMVFARPGMGQLLVRGILMRDYPMVQGMLIFLVICVIVANIVADILIAVANPRIKFE